MPLRLQVYAKLQRIMLPVHLSASDPEDNVKWTAQKN